MGKVLVTDSYLGNIANAIRKENSSTTTYKPSEMGPAITKINSDVATELNTQTALLSTQTSKLNNVVNVLREKGSHEDLTTELSQQTTLLSTQTSKLNSVVAALENKGYYT